MIWSIDCHDITSIKGAKIIHIFKHACVGSVGFLLSFGWTFSQSCEKSCARILHN